MCCFLRLHLQICFCLSFGTLAAAQDIILQPELSGNFRFKDITGQAFSNTYATIYSYSSASVTITFDDSPQAFLSGTIAAAGLKPNFAYQIKLIGRPSRAAISDSDRILANDGTNEVLGRLGRWWRMQPNPANALDADYDANKDNPAYIYQGYLIVGFFVTDAMGNANAKFEGHNSFHVLWRADQRVPTQNDGPLAAVAIPDTSGNPAYDTATARRMAQLYGEWEPTRVLPGALAMPFTEYHCQLALTEESFHDSGALAGAWTMAMQSAVDFKIPTHQPGAPPPPDAPPPPGAPSPPDAPPPPDVPTVPPGTTTGVKGLTITGIRAFLNDKTERSDSIHIAGMLTLPDNLALQNLAVEATMLGSSHKFVLDFTGHARLASSKANRFVIHRIRGSNETLFKLSINKADLLLNESSDPLQVRLDLKLQDDNYSGSSLLRVRSMAGRKWLSFRHVPVVERAIPSG